MPSGTGGDRNAIRYRWKKKCHQVQVEIEMPSGTGGDRNAIRYRWI